MALRASETLWAEISNCPHPTPLSAGLNIRNLATQSLHLLGRAHFSWSSSFSPQVHSESPLSPERKMKLAGWLGEFASGQILILGAL